MCVVKPIYLLPLLLLFLPSLNFWANFSLKSWSEKSSCTQYFLFTFHSTYTRTWHRILVWQLRVSSADPVLCLLDTSLPSSLFNICLKVRMRKNGGRRIRRLYLLPPLSWTSQPAKYAWSDDEERETERNEPARPGRPDLVMTSLSLFQSWKKTEDTAGVTIGAPLPTSPQHPSSRVSFPVKYFTQIQHFVKFFCSLVQFISKRFFGYGKKM